MNANVDRLLNQTVSWQAKTAVDSWNTPTYGDAVTIRACKQERLIEAAGPGGFERRQSNAVFVTEDVALGDKIDGEIVQGRDSGTRISGDTILYRLVTE